MILVERLKGILMIVIGSVFWGATGPMMEWLLHNTEMTVIFMLSIRLMTAGIIILTVLHVQRKSVLAIWKERTWRLQLLLFAVLGMALFSYSFVRTIDESNAIVATLLQFLAPIFIIVYLSAAYKAWPQKNQVIGIAGTLFGLFLLLTNGSLSSLLVSKTALIWGVVLGLAYAFYTLYPKRLMAKWGVLQIVAWGMVIGGAVLAFIGRIWTSDEWQLLKEPVILLMMLALVFLSTTAFVLFLMSLHYISAVETSVLSSVEPLTSMLISVCWFGTIIRVWQLAGIALMIFFIVFLSITGAKKEIRKPAH